MIKTVLVTGGNGVIGSFIFNKFKKEYSITALCKSQKKSEIFYTLDLTKNIDIINFSDKSPKFDALIFLVGLAHKKGKGKESKLFRMINKQTLVNLLSVLKERNKIPDKIIFASTISVYGEKIDKSSYVEDSNKSPFSPYALTKLEAEDYLLKNFKSKSWVLRFAPVYSSSFLLNINRRIKIGNFYFKIGDGSKKMSLCNIENIGDTIEGILQEKVPSGIYNLSDQYDYSYNDIFKHMKVKWFIPIPFIIIKVLYYIGLAFNNIYIRENSIKLISDNIFPSTKIRKNIKLSNILNND